MSIFICTQFHEQLVLIKLKAASFNKNEVSRRPAIQDE